MASRLSDWLSDWLSGVPRWFRAEPYRIAAAALLLAGLVLRLVLLPDARFTGDEALFYEEATRAAQGDWFPWIGPAVTGGPAHHPGGSFYLLMALPLLLADSPLAPMTLVVVLNLLGYGLLTSLVRRLMGARVAIAFLVLLLFGPWSLFYSDRIWNSNLVLPLAALFFWGLADAVRTARSRRVFWAVFALTVFPQFHLSVALLVLMGGLLVAVYHKRPSFSFAFAGFGAGLLTYVPYFVMELKHGFANTKLLLTTTAGTESGPTEAVRALLGYLVLPTGEMSYFAERGYWFRHDLAAFYTKGAGLAGMADFFGGGAFGWTLVGVAVASVVAVLVGVGVLLWTLVADRARRTELLANPLVPAFLLSLGVVPLAFVLSKKPYFPHYVYPFYPLAFVPLLVLVWRFAKGRAYGVMLAVAGLFALGGAASSWHYYRVVDGVVGVRSSEQIVRTVWEATGDHAVAISFDVEKSRLDPYPLVRMAEWQFGRPIHLDGRAAQRLRVFSPARWAVFSKAPTARQRIDGRPVVGHAVLDRAVVAWTKR